MSTRHKLLFITSASCVLNPLLKHPHPLLIYSRRCFLPPIINVGSKHFWDISTISVHQNTTATDDVCEEDCMQALSSMEYNSFTIHKVDTRSGIVLWKILSVRHFDIYMSCYKHRLKCLSGFTFWLGNGKLYSKNINTKLTGF